MAESDIVPWSIKQVVVHKNTPHATVQWELRGGKRTFGRPVRRYFDKKSDATKKARELSSEFRAHGSQATQLTDTQRADAVTAFKLLGNKRMSLVTAVEFFLKHGPKEESCDTETAVIRFLETRGVSKKEIVEPGKHRDPEARQRRFKGYSWKHRASLSHRMRPFLKRWKKEPVGALCLKRVELQTWLQQEFETVTTLDNHRRTIHSFFAWAISQNLASENPAKRWLELSKLLKDEKKRKRPGILKVQQLGQLLKAAQADDLEILPCLAIGAFSGIRTEELSGLTWSMIGEDFIHIPSWLSKTSDPRDIKVHSTLLAWLKVVPRGQMESRVLPGDFGQRRLEICKKLEIAWPHNALRHSFGSYRYAQTGDIAATTFEMRHEDPQTFRQYYLNRGISKKEAESYWALLPGSNI